MKRLGSLFCGWAFVATSLAVGQEVIREERTTTPRAGTPTTARSITAAVRRHQNIGVGSRLAGRDREGKAPTEPSLPARPARPEPRPPGLNHWSANPRFDSRSNSSI